MKDDKDDMGFMVIKMFFLLLNCNKVLYKGTIMRYKGIIKSITIIYKLMLPRGKSELIIFFSTFFWFLILSSFLSFLVDFEGRDVELMGYDTKFYISGDNPKLLFSKLLSWNIRHPLFVMINLPSMIVDLFLPSYFHYFVYAFSSCILSAFSNLLIYKICRNVGVDVISSVIVVVLYPSFAHVLLLSGQPETFVFTQFLTLLLILLTILNLSTCCIDNIIFALLTGTTLTNSIKFFLVKFCESNFDIIKTVIKTFRSTFLFLFLFSLTLSGLIYRIVYKKIPIDVAFFNDTMKFVHSLPNRLYLAWNHFLSEPIIFHSSSSVIYTKDATTLESYPFSFFHYIVAFLLVFALVGLFKNRRFFIVKIVFSCIMCDVVIHFVFGYGLNELQLFCEHWIFFIPISIALGLSSLKSNNLRIFFIIILFILSLFLSSYNSYCYLNSLF